MVWFHRTMSREEQIVCPRCGNIVTLDAPALDHHSGWCPKCSVECLFFSFSDSHIQIVLEDAPSELRSVIRWMQDNFDELEFLCAVTALEQIAKNQPQEW